MWHEMLRGDHMRSQERDRQQNRSQRVYGNMKRV